MKQLLISLFFLGIFSVNYSQTTANFSLRDDSKKIMCYTEYSNGIAVKDTKVEFKTIASTGTCKYVYDFGDGSSQIIKDNNSNTMHEYTTDGSFDVRLQVVNTTSIHDSIKNRPIQQILYIANSNDSVDLSIQYTGTDNAQRTATVKIPEDEYAKKTLPYPIIVYSPVVDGQNFTYIIDDPSTDEIKAPIKSFTHIFTVDTTKFKPHTPELWTYYWEVFATNEFGEPKGLPISTWHIDSLEYKYTFPAESFNPGYYVQLKIALDSTKIDDVAYYNLEQCYATQTQIIPVTDYFFTDQTQKETDIDQRKANIPNIFTPGGGDENDVFYFNTNGKDIFTIWIYNSWGTNIYKQEALTISWTGTDNAGENCPSGVYYYVIKSNNADDRHETSGFIQLFRQN